MLDEKMNLAKSHPMLIDWDLLMSRVGDEELADEIVPIFLSDSIERMDKLSAACACDDCQEVKFYAHAIKGSSGIVGASELSSLSSDLECAAREGDLSRIHSLFPHMKDIFDSLAAFLSEKDWKTVAKQQSADRAGSGQG